MDWDWDLRDFFKRKSCLFLPVLTSGLNRVKRLKDVKSMLPFRLWSICLAYETAALFVRHGRPHRPWAVMWGAVKMHWARCRLWCYSFFWGPYGFPCLFVELILWICFVRSVPFIPFIFFHFPFICFHVSFISFRVLSLSFHYLFIFLSCFFHFLQSSFHVPFIVPFIPFIFPRLNPKAPGNRMAPQSWALEEPGSSTQSWASWGR